MQRPVRVLQVLEATVGGTRRHLLSILEGIDRQRFAVEVAAPGVRYGKVADDSFRSDVQNLNVPLYLVDLRRNIHPWIDLQAFITLYRLIRQGRYDVVHLHSSKAGFIGRFAAKLAGVPTVYTPNGFYFLQSEQSALAKRLFLDFERLAGRATDCLIAVSPSECGAAIGARLIQPERIRVIPNAIKYQAFQANPSLATQMRHELGIPLERFVVGIVSRYIPQKDPLTIVHTAKSILDRDPNVLFVWCGEGEMRTQTEQLARNLAIHDSFLFLGFRQDVQAVMQTFDLFLLASIFEGLPYTLLETMSMGIPVVATSVVGTQDVIQDGLTGSLVPPGFPELLADSVLRMIADPDLRESLGKSGKSRVHSVFSLEKMIDEIQSVYVELSAS